MNSHGDPEIKRVIEGGKYVEDELGFFWRRLRPSEIVRPGDGCEFTERFELDYKGFMDLQIISPNSTSMNQRADFVTLTLKYRKLDHLIYHMMRAKEKHAKTKAKTKTRCGH